MPAGRHPGLPPGQRGHAHRTARNSEAASIWPNLSGPIWTRAVTISKNLAVAPVEPACGGSLVRLPVATRAWDGRGDARRRRCLAGPVVTGCPGSSDWCRVQGILLAIQRRGDSQFAAIAGLSAFFVCHWSRFAGRCRAISGRRKFSEAGRRHAVAANRPGVVARRSIAKPLRASHPADGIRAHSRRRSLWCVVCQESFLLATISATIVSDLAV